MPQAAPGILTGTILAVSRGAGEVAPILFTGAAYFLPQLPKHLSSQFMSPGYHVYVLATQSPDVDATKPHPLRDRAGPAGADLHAQHGGRHRPRPDPAPARRGGVSATANGVAKPEPQPKLVVRNLTVFYGEKKAVGPVAMDIVGQHVTALIGPSGCGKSTFLRSLNRMNELIPSCRIEGEVKLDGDPIYGQGIDPVAVRRRIGMVFQRSNPFPKSMATPMDTQHPTHQVSQARC